MPTLYLSAVLGVSTVAGLILDKPFLLHVYLALRWVSLGLVTTFHEERWKWVVRGAGVGTVASATEECSKASQDIEWTRRLGGRI